MKPSSATLAPHPLLTAYYPSNDAKRSFLRGLFDHTASDYDRIERLMALGTGSWYRRQAFLRAGLTAGQRVLDVAVGTGLTAREAAVLAGGASHVIGLDPSAGMLAHAVRQLGIRGVQGAGEQIPLADGAFDFVSMGYALRHLSDLAVTFREFRRVLRTGGRLCILEITRPRGRLAMLLLKCYMKGLVPCLTRIVAGQRDTQRLWRYYWETIDVCIAPEKVMQALIDAGFQNVRRHVELGIFSEYTANA